MKTLLAKLLCPLFERTIFTRRLPMDLGGAPIYVSPRNDARVMRKSIAEMDPELLAAARLLVRPGASVWDIGSSLGIFSVAAAHLAGEKGSVLAVDADASHVELLRRTVRRAGYPNITPLHCAVAAGVGVTRLNIVGRGKAKNFIEEADSAAAFDTVVEQHAVVTVTLDWLATRFPAPDVLKVDIECAEVMALHGAKALLQGPQPAIYIEVYPQNVAAASEVLHQNGYSLFEIQSGGSVLKPIEQCCFNTLALPAKRIAGFQERIAR